MYNITLIKGDGIGPEVSLAAKRILDATGITINWDIHSAGNDSLHKNKKVISDELYHSIETNKLVLKGPITTPIGYGYTSINVGLRKKYDLYSNIRPIKSLASVPTRYKEVDFTIFRENTEGLYIGEEIKVSQDEYNAIKKVTRSGSYRIIKKAFEYAKSKNIPKVTVAHKANILKKTDGLFLAVAREVSADYSIELEELIIDNMCMQLVKNPKNYQVIVTTNLYGDIISDLSAGLIGGLGMAPGANIGDNMAIFEAVHGSAPDIAGKNIANPTAMIRSSIMMLEYLKEYETSKKIEIALERVYANKDNWLPDLGGNNTMDKFVDAVIANLEE